MRKISAAFAGIGFAVEIIMITLSLPIYSQAIISGTFIAILFYFILKSENVVDEYKPLNFLTSKAKTKILSKTAQPSKKSKSKLKSNSKLKEKDEEKSEFMAEWEHLQKVAG